MSDQQARPFFLVNVLISRGGIMAIIGGLAWSIDDSIYYVLLTRRSAEGRRYGVCLCGGLLGIPSI